MATIRRPNWADYYQAISTQEGSDERTLVEQGLGSMNATNAGMIEKEASFLNVVVQHPTFTFLIIPGARNSVVTLHGCIVDDPNPDESVVGILGNNFSSPRKAVSVKSLVQGFPLTATRRGDDAKTPSLAKFLEATTAEEFSKLEGDADGEDFSFIKNNFPSALFLPPQLYLSADIGPTMKADVLGARIALIAAGGYADDDSTDEAAEPIPQSAKDVKPVLIFLWALARGMGRAIGLRDASLSDQADRNLDAVTDQAKSVTTAILGNENGGTNPTDAANPSQDGDAKLDDPTNKPDRKRAGLKRRGNHDDADDPSDDDDRDASPRRNRHHRRNRRRRSRSESSESDRSRHDRNRDDGRRPKAPETTPTVPESPGPLPAGSSMQEMMIYNQGLMIQNLAMFSRQGLVSQQREERKRSMMANLLEEDEALFTLLSANGWRDSKPEMPVFTSKLMAVKDVNIAWARISKKIRTWPGRVSQKQFAKFLRTGFVANDIDECPGGFTLLMFRPLKYPVARSVKAEQNAIRQMLGETKVDPETVKFYAENEFFIAMETAHLEDQLTMGLRMLSLLTGPDSIALDGYKYGLETLHENYRMFERFFREDPLFGARFAHLLDKSFQNFASRLQTYHDRSDPVRSARRRLEYLMEDELGQVLKTSHLGITPRTVLPAELLLAKEEEVEGGEWNPPLAAATSQKKPKAKVLEDGPSWHAVNPNPTKTWALPNNKKFPDYFASKDDNTKVNLADWPHFPHHAQTDLKRQMCVKYQVLGKCRKACYLAHIEPDKMTADARNKCNDRFKAIYS
jgi:hypothetical protein